MLEPIEALLPHRGPARLVHAVVSGSDGSATPGARGEITCLARVPADHPLVFRGRAPALIAFEMAAQAAAVLSTLASGGGAPRIGYLVSVREARLGVADVPALQDLLVTVRAGGGMAPLHSYEVRVTTPAGAEVLRGTLGTFIPEAV